MEEGRVLGEMSAYYIINALEAIGDMEAADCVRRHVKPEEMNIAFSEIVQRKPPEPPPVFTITDHAYGFIPSAEYLKAKESDDSVPISDAGAIKPDLTLKDQLIKVTLDRLRVADYPGSGIHNIMFDFYGRHQAIGQQQDIHFTQNFRANEGQGAGITGYPIFIGLKVGREGVSFRCETINVENEDSKRLLGYLDTDVFKNGLELINAVNPALPIITGLATGIAKAFLTKDQNKIVQKFDMGLDFSDILTRAKLREGSYIVVQALRPFDWTKWKYRPSSGEVISMDDQTKMIPFNYIVFSISKMEQQTP